ncbi:hypothetical protein Tco_1361803 [Tanacetum coccineum]
MPYSLHCYNEELIRRINAVKVSYLRTKNWCQIPVVLRKSNLAFDNCFSCLLRYDSALAVGDLYLWSDWRTHNALRTCANSSTRTSEQSISSSANLLPSLSQSELLISAKTWSTGLRLDRTSRNRAMAYYIHERGASLDRILSSRVLLGSGTQMSFVSDVVRRRNSNLFPSATDQVERRVSRFCCKRSVSRYNSREWRCPYMRISEKPKSIATVQYSLRVLMCREDDEDNGPF